MDYAQETWQAVPGTYRFVTTRIKSRPEAVEKVPGLQKLQASASEAPASASARQRIHQFHIQGHFDFLF